MQKKAASTENTCLKIFETPDSINFPIHNFFSDERNRLLFFHNRISMQVLLINISSTDGSFTPSVLWTKFINIPAPDNTNDRILDFEIY